MLNGNGSLSLRKTELENQKIPAIGFTKLYFAHKASAAATGINLASLNTPSEMTANGFVQPTSTQLAAAQLLFYKNNLRIESSARGLLIQGLSYVVSSSTQITFIDFTALEGEIFTGTIDYSAQTGVKVVDATAQPATGTLAAAATDFNIGNAFQTNKYSTTRVGAVLVYKDRMLQKRNTGNSSSVLDGDYYELDNGSGSFSVIRFNVADPDNASDIIVTPNGLLSERPDGSMMAVIENINGQLQNMATYVAAAVGQSTTTVLGAAPSNVDLKAFGDRVYALEARATVDENPTLQSDIIATRLGQKTYLHGTTYNGGLAPTTTSALSGFSVIRAVFIPYQMQDGTWRMRFNLAAFITPGATTTGIIAVNGVLFKNIVNFYQPIAAMFLGSPGVGTPQQFYVNYNSNQIVIAQTSATVSGLDASGDVELETKPTWAY